MILAEKIMELRKKSGWSQEELAGQLGISRQSVSKWESGASIPDIDKIITMSALFGVSTDYLLKDELEKELPSETAQPEHKSGVCQVSAEEADSFLKLTRKLATPIAAAVAMFILCPIPLIVLAGMQEYGKLGMSENAAGGIGLVILLLFVVVGVALSVLTNAKLERYDPFGKEELELQYGVRGIVMKKKEEFAGSYSLGLIFGISLCILSVVPIMVALAVYGEESIALIYSVGILLGMNAAGVFMIVRVAGIQESFQKLLQEGDYTQEKKRLDKRIGFLPVAYWCIATAIFLYMGLQGNNWKAAPVFWPIAALGFVAIRAIVSAFAKNRKGDAA